MIWQFVQSFLRHGLTSVGAVLVTKGLASQGDTDTAVGAIMVLIGFGHSLYVKWKSQQPPTSGPTPGPRVPVMLFAVCLLLAFAPLSFTGCQTTPQQITYRSAGTAIVTVDTAMHEWGAYVASNHPSTNTELAVRSAYEKYQAGMALACDAG